MTASGTTRPRRPIASGSGSAGVPTISEMVGMAAQAVGDGLCHTCLVIYPTGNLEGR
jgi:hypothetical protein